MCSYISCLLSLKQVTYMLHILSFHSFKIMVNLDRAENLSKSKKVVPKITAAKDLINSHFCQCCFLYKVLQDKRIHTKLLMVIFQSHWCGQDGWVEHGEWAEGAWGVTMWDMGRVIG